MPASDIIDLYKYEDAIETAVKTLLTANSLTSYRQRDTDARVTPSASIQFTTGSGVEHYHGFSDCSRRPDVFQGSLAIAIVTDRGKNDSSHSTWRATVRNLIYGFIETLNPIIAYHAILRVLESGTTATITSEDNQDASVINFTVDFCIRTDAWPSQASPTN